MSATENNPATPLRDQRFDTPLGVRFVTAVRHPSTGARSLAISPAPGAGPGSRVPLVPIGLAALASGRDAWMLEVKVRCAECHEIVRVRDIGSDAGVCEDCLDAEDAE